jgi:exodeoxyribonuclease V alpha subunit
MSEVLYYLPKYRVMEEELAYITSMFIKKIKCDKIPFRTDKLSDKQSIAVENACSNKISLIRGYAGTGKSTVIKRILLSFLEAGMKGAVFCPTAKAAKRVKEILQDNEKEEDTISLLSVEICTMHIGLKPRFSKDGFDFTYNENNYLDFDFIVIDEASMGGLFIFNRLFRSIDFNRTRVIITGDENQLPSVDPGNIFYDLINITQIPSVHLDVIFRQGKNSGIVKNSARVLNGNDLISYEQETRTSFSDIEIANIENGNSILSYLLKSIDNSKYDFMKDIQILCPGKLGEVGTDELNLKLGNKFNCDNKIIKIGNKSFRINDKVINRRNMYQMNVVNGDSGLITDIKDNLVIVDFGPGTGKKMNGIAEFDINTISSLHLSYCSTVHSSQGSQYKFVIFPLTTSHWMLLFRNLLYTGMTRAIEKLVLVYQKKALSRAIKNNTMPTRRTTLGRAILSRL